MSVKIFAFLAIVACAFAAKVMEEPSMEPTAEPSPMICFPSSATVSTESGDIKTMDKLAVGDRVAVGGGRFSEVFAFTHKDAAINYNFMELSTAAGPKITLTNTHFLPVNGEYTAAGSAKVGDLLELADGSSTKITTIKVVPGTGLYNPQTASGDIIVDGVRASTYTTAIEQCMAHALLAPLRAIAARFGFYTTALDNAASIIA